MNKLFERLVPARLRKTPELSGEKRRALLATVADNDSCLRAVEDLLGDVIEGHMSVAFDPERPPEKRLEACNRAGIAAQLLGQLESERAAAKEWANKK